MVAQSAAMSHGMARIRLGRLGRVLVTFMIAAAVTICLNCGDEKNLFPLNFVIPRLFKS